jgi:hypothetical protein
VDACGFRETVPDPLWISGHRVAGPYARAETVPDPLWKSETVPDPL